MTQTWTVEPQEDGSYACHDGTRLRAVIQRDSPRSWRVTRVNSKGRHTGGDNFHSFAECKAFVTESHIFGPAGDAEEIARKSRLEHLRLFLVTEPDLSLVQAVTRVYGGTDSPAARDDLKSLLNEGLDV